MQVELDPALLATADGEVCTTDDELLRFCRCLSCSMMLPTTNGVKRRRRS